MPPRRTGFCYMLEAVRETSEWSTTEDRINSRLLDNAGERMRQGLAEIYSRELAEVIFVNPYCRIGDVVSPASSSVNRHQST